MTSGQHLSTPVPKLDSALTHRLRGVAARLRSYVFVDGIAWLAGFLVLASLVQFGLDYGLRGLRLSMRVALLAAMVCGVGWVVWRHLVSPLRQRIGEIEIASLLERRYPALTSVLVSAVRFASAEHGGVEANSPSLMASVVERARHESDGLDFGVVLTRRNLHRSIAVLALTLLFTASVSFAAPEVVGLWFARNILLKEIPWPQRTHLVVDLEGNELIAARGDDVVIEARAMGVQPREVDILFEMTEGTKGRETMVTVGSVGSYRYRHTFKNAQQDMSFRLRGGDDLTQPYHVRLLDRPAVTTSRIRIVPPEYVRQDSILLPEGQRSVRVLPGTSVEISIETNKPVVTANLVAASDSAVAAVASGGGYSVSFHATESQTYHFELVDEYELQNRRPARFSIRIQKDEAPTVRMKLAGVGDMITPEAVLPIEVSFSDKYGLAEAELTYQLLREGALEEQITLPGFEDYTTSFLTTVHWPVASSSPVPGDRLTLIARASDHDNVSGPNLGQSAEVSLRVVTRDELLAELARREQEYRHSFERLVEAQEEVRGRVLSLRGEFTDTADTAKLAAEVTPVERRQRNLAGSVNVIRQQFEQILAELRVNQLDTGEEIGRLADGILGPLTELAKRDLILAADTMRKWSGSGSGELADELDDQQARVLTKMRSVLANMLQWEGYHEVVNMMREIIRLQRELSDEVKKKHVEEAEDVFED